MGLFDGITDYSLFDGTDDTKNVKPLFDINAGNDTSRTSAPPVHPSMTKKPAPF